MRRTIQFSGSRRFFLRRWSMETTFQEVRLYRGLEGQLEWNDLAVARSTPSHETKRYIGHDPFVENYVTKNAWPR
jgi:hypothetical protein